MKGGFLRTTVSYFILQSQIHLMNFSNFLYYILYVQEVVTLQKKYFNIFASENYFINDILGWILFVYMSK